jgi:predicted MFS family arabinose efflux permease
VLLLIGFLPMGAGLAVPYASAPRLALSALSPAQTGQGSGIVNACTFLGGSVGVAGGAIALSLGGFGAVLTMIAIAGIVGAALSRWISKTG